MAATLHRGLGARLADVVVLACVCKNAAWSIVHRDFGQPADAVQALLWYGLAGFYAIASWALTAGDRLPPHGRAWATSTCCAGAAACLYGAWSLGQAAHFISWRDWAFLALAYGLIAICFRPTRG